MRGGLLLALVLLAGVPARAAEIKVLTAGAFRSVFAAIVPGFEQATGHHVDLQNDTAGGVAKRIAAGEAFDLAVLTPPTIAPLVQAGRIAGPAVPVATVGIGVGVRQGAAAPDLSTPDSFKAALLAARAVALVDPASGGSSGIYMVELFARMGIAAEMAPKLVLVHGGLAGDRVASGEAELAVQQASEILAATGVTLAGPIPEALQSRTTYVAGLAPGAGAPAQALLTELTGARTRGVLAGKGMDAP